MDGYAVMVCPDAQLKSFGMDAIGDILAVKNFVMQHSPSNINTNEKSYLAKVIRGDVEEHIPKRRKDTRLIKVGLQNYCFKKRKYVGVRKCGGTRDIDVKKTANVSYITEQAISCYFSEGRNCLGHKATFKFSLANFSCEVIDADVVDSDGNINTWTVEKYVTKHKLTHVRLYLLAKKKTWRDLSSISDDSEDGDLIDFVIPQVSASSATITSRNLPETSTPVRSGLIGDTRTRESLRNEIDLALKRSLENGPEEGAGKDNS